jgi:hypothetical protein
MKASVKRLTRPLLQWSVCLVVLWKSWLTFHSALPRNVPGHPAALAHVRLLLSGTEMLAAILFLVPVTSRLGGSLLLVIFALALIIHTLHGDASGPETLVVYAAAVLVCLAERRESVPSGT